MEFKDRIKHITNDSYTVTLFLTLQEQAQVKHKLKDVNYTLFGGYPNSERKRLYVNQEPFDITCFKIRYNSQFLTLTHQNILGSLLSLNIKKEAIGDILAKEDCFFMIGELEDFILNEFKMINNRPIELEIIDGSTVFREIELEEHIAYVDSLRLDLVVSRIAKKSRNESTMMIENELVSINHVVVTNKNKVVKENDILSIRKHGRFRVLDTSHTSKKGKIVLKYGKFI
jgi:RNA-binding protein YlmH